MFEDELESALRQKRLRQDVDVMELCYPCGVMRKHAGPVLKRLRDEGCIQIDFQRPTLDHLDQPRSIRYR